MVDSAGKPVCAMIRYGAFGNFLWLWVVPVLAVVLAYSTWRRRRVMEVFIGSNSVTRLAGDLSVPRVISRAACIVAAAGLIVFALAQPQWGKYWTQQRAAGRDIIVALDVSRSMLADDVTPSRLERAKADVYDLVTAVEETGGHRLGLIAFAGSATLKCPLTQVTSYFKLALDAIEPRSVAQGGTLIGDCIRAAIDAFDDKTQNFRDLILITDGEDMDSFPVEAATAARDAGITIYAIGIGDSNQGSRIPLTDKAGRRTYLEYQGEVVWSKLDERSLKEIAQITGGIYVPAGTRAIELDRIFRDVIEPKTKREMDGTRREQLHHRFQWFLAPAVLLLMVDMLIRDTRRRPQRNAATGTVQDDMSTAAPSSTRQRDRQSLLPTASIALAVLLTFGHDARAADAGSLVREGNVLYEKGKYHEAAEKFAEASRLAPTSPIPLFNQASALFQAGDYAGAAKLYEQARVYAPNDMRRMINYALGNCNLQQALQAQAQPNVATQQAKQATQFYREALAAPPNRPDSDSVGDASRYNMELAKRLIQLMQEKQNQKQQEQQGQEKDNRDQSQQNAEQDRQEGKENQGTEQDQSKDKGDQKEDAQEQRGDGKDQQQDQGQQGRSKEEQAKPSQAEVGQKLSQDEASDRLRAAIARAQVARSRRLNEQNKQVKPRPGVKDW
jgi:Ca-activated chloride channel family protein